MRPSIITFFDKKKYQSGIRREITVRIFVSIVKKMGVLNNLFGCVFVCLAMISSSIKADSCIMKGPCVCEFSNGTGIDLRPIGSAKVDFYEAQIYEQKENGSIYELSTYYYHPCVDIDLKYNATAKDTCGEPLSICRHKNIMTLNSTTSMYSLDSGAYEFMGKTSVSNFSSEGDSIIYYNGPSSTIVLLICAETEGNLQIYSLQEPNKIVLAFYSKEACLKQVEEVGRSVGSTLLVIFFSCVVFYLVLGICTKKFLMGATGIEVIPNLAFWADLPNLVKDGWAFAINGFKLPVRSSGPTTSPDPNSYDSI